MRHCKSNFVDDKIQKSKTHLVNYVDKPSSFGCILSKRNGAKKSFNNGSAELWRVKTNIPYTTNLLFIDEMVCMECPFKKDEVYYR